MPPEILPLRPNQCSQAASLLARAFVDDPAFVGMMPDLHAAERLKRSAILFATDLAADLSRGCPFCIADHADQQRILAALLAYPPEGYPLSAVEQVRMLLSIIVKGKPFLPGRWRVFQRLMFLLNETAKNHPKQPHYYVEWLGVDPACQGQGLGSSLLKHILQRADAERMPVYLETAQPRNLPLYRRFGFEAFHQQTILDIPVYFLWRDVG